MKTPCDHPSVVKSLILLQVCNHTSILRIFVRTIISRLYPLCLSLFFAVTSSVFGQDGDLYFSVSPGEHSVAEGSPVRLRCEAQPSSRVKYAWKIDGQPLAPSPRRHQDGGDLRITRVNRILDSGNFVCVATHEETGYSIESSPAKIDIQCKSFFVSILIFFLSLSLSLSREKNIFRFFDREKERKREREKLNRDRPSVSKNGKRV